MFLKEKKEELQRLEKEYKKTNVKNIIDITVTTILSMLISLPFSNIIYNAQMSYMLLKDVIVPLIAFGLPVISAVLVALLNQKKIRRLELKKEILRTGIMEDEKEEDRKYEKEKVKKLSKEEKDVVKMVIENPNIEEVIRYFIMEKDINDSFNDELKEVIYNDDSSVSEDFIKHIDKK